MTNYNFKDPATKMMEGLINFHHDVMSYLVFIAFLVLYFLFSIVYGEGNKKKTQAVSIQHNTTVEYLWTVIPIGILVFIGLPSFSLLYSINYSLHPELTVKVTGHQWYWNYEYSPGVSVGEKFDTHTNNPLFVSSTLVPRTAIRNNPMSSSTDFSWDRMDLFFLFDKVKHRRHKTPEFATPMIIEGFKNVYTSYKPNKLGKWSNSAFINLNSFVSKQSLKSDSYMLTTSSLIENNLTGFRLLEVDFQLTLPTHTNIRFLITSQDVLHSWAVPALGIKLDACPGRINQVTCYITREAIFYGQCSEICGVNHGFMPIVIRSVAPRTLGRYT